MKVYIIIEKRYNKILAVFDRYELALCSVEVNKDNGVECEIYEMELLNRLSIKAIKHLELKYL